MTIIHVGIHQAANAFLNGGAERFNEVGLYIDARLESTQVLALMIDLLSMYSTPSTHSSIVDFDPVTSTSSRSNSNPGRDGRHIPHENMRSATAHIAAIEFAQINR